MPTLPQSVAAKRMVCSVRGVGRTWICMLLLLGASQLPLSHSYAHAPRALISPRGHTRARAQEQDAGVNVAGSKGSSYGTGNNNNRKSSYNNRQQNSNSNGYAMPFPFSGPPEVVREKVLQELAKLANARDAAEYTLVFKNAAARSLVFGSSNIADDALATLNALLELFSASQISDILWSVSRTGFTLSSKPHRQLIMQLVHRLCEVPLQELTPKVVTTAVGGIAKVNMRWYQIPESTQKDILVAVKAVALRLNAREVGNLLHSLSKIKVPWTVLGAPTQQMLLESFARTTHELVDQQGAMAIYSLGLMGLDISACAPAVRDKLLLVAVAVLRKDDKPQVDGADRSDVQQKSNVIYGLAKLRASYAELPATVREAMEDSLARCCHLMIDQEVANVLYSLGVMGARWAALPSGATAAIEAALQNTADKMIIQGVSNVVYGLGLMGAAPSDLGATCRDALYGSIVRIYSPNAQGDGATREGNGQAIANIIYSLGTSGDSWSELPARVRRSLECGVVEYADELSSQEISNLVYGLGMLGAQLAELPRLVGEAIMLAFQKVCRELNEQEVCSIMYGFAYMGANWVAMPEVLRRSMLVSIANLDKVDNVCLACTIYTLGLLGARWEQLPLRLREILCRTAERTDLRDQVLSNILYGLALMEVSWLDLEEGLRSKLLATFQDKVAEDIFSSSSRDFPQHLSNSLWGLAKMQVPLALLPADKLEEFVRKGEAGGGNSSFKPQEITNTIYSLTLMDAKWRDLAVETRLALRDSIIRLNFSVQELGNLMYSLSILTFESHIASSGCLKKEREAMEREHRVSYLWDVHRKLLLDFQRQLPEIKRSSGATAQPLPGKVAAAGPPASAEMEYYDQFAMYFALMNSVPQCKAFVCEVLGCKEVPTVSGPGPTVPSALHTNVVRSTSRALQLLEHGVDGGSRFSFFNEFNGLRDVLNIDCAVYFDDRLLAFIEIDGGFHYNPVSNQLRSKDRMKESLYALAFPSIPLFRIRWDQVEVLGHSRIGSVLADWIVDKSGMRKDVVT